MGVVRRAQRRRFPERPSGKDISYYFESLDFAAIERKLSAYYAEFQTLPPRRARSHQHAGFEFVYVLQGRLELTIGAEPYSLNHGDSIYFDSSVAHAYRKLGRKPCSAVVVTTP